MIIINILVLLFMLNMWDILIKEYVKDWFLLGFIVVSWFILVLWGEFLEIEDEDSKILRGGLLEFGIWVVYCVVMIVYWFDVWYVILFVLIRNLLVYIIE